MRPAAPAAPRPLAIAARNRRSPNKPPPSPSTLNPEPTQSWTHTGHCRYGTRCLFAHGEHELRPYGGHPPDGGAGGAAGPGAAHALAQLHPPGGEEDVYARQGFPVQGPNGWVMYRTQDTGDIYFHNHNSQLTQWQRPADWPSAAS